MKKRYKVLKIISANKEKLYFATNKARTEKIKVLLERELKGDKNNLCGPGGRPSEC